MVSLDNKVYLPTYVALTVLYAKHANSSFVVDELRNFLSSNKEAGLVLNGTTPGGFITSSKINVNYLTGFDGHTSRIPDDIYEIIARSDVNIVDGVANISLQSELDLHLFNIWHSFKSVNAAIWDGKRSLVGNVMQQLKAENVIKSAHRDSKKNHNLAKSGTSSIASRQVVYGMGVNTRTLVNTKNIITWSDIIQDKKYCFNKEAIEAKISSNQIVGIYKSANPEGFSELFGKYRAWVDKLVAGSGD